MRGQPSTGAAASRLQRLKIHPEGGTVLECIVCAMNGRLGVPAQAAHGLPRTWWGCDHPDCVLPLCDRHHAMWDGRAGSERLLLLPALMSQAARDEFRAVRGHQPNPEIHPEDFALLVKGCPDTFEQLIQMIDSDWHSEIVHMYEEIEKHLGNGEWPFARWEIPDLGHLPFRWVKRRSRLTPHTVLCAVLFLSSAVLVKRKVDNWTEGYWWYFFRRHGEARAPQNLKWYLGSNPKFRAWFEENRPDLLGWEPPLDYPGDLDSDGDCVMCAAAGREVSGIATPVLPDTLWPDAGDASFTLCGSHRELFLGEVQGEGLALYPALLSRKARRRYEQANGRPLDPASPDHLSVLLGEFPSTFDDLAAILDPAACKAVEQVYQDIERFLVADEEWPFARSELDRVTQLPFDWVRAGDRLTPYMVLAAILVFGTGVLVQKRIDGWDEERWWRFFERDQRRRSPENLEWYCRNNPRLARWYAKHRPDEHGWSLGAYRASEGRRQQQKQRARQVARRRESK